MFIGERGKGNLFDLASTLLALCVGLLLGMCESVRTRNTLHIVGARKSSICYDAVERRKVKKEKKEKKENKLKIVNYENVIKLNY